jgi:hypothetical protein
MNDRSRGIAEFLGLILVAASLLFVAFQMQQDRKIARAELNTTLMEIFASRMEAGLESDAYLGMWNELYRANAWDTAGLSEAEIAAAEIDAFLAWTYLEAAFEQYREGLMSDASWKDTELELIQFWGFAPYRAVYETYYRNTPTEFVQAINRLLPSEADPTGTDN